MASVVAALLLASCISTGSHLGTHAAPANDCRAITGTYFASGNKTDSGSTPWLSPIFFSDHNSDDGARAFGADRIVFAWETQGRLRVRALREGKELASRVLSPEDGTLNCVRGALHLKGYFGGTHGRGNPVVGLEWSDATVVPATDGALLVKQSGGAVGLVYVFLPIALTETEWSRFPRVADR